MTPMLEYEAKFLNVDVDALVAKLVAVGGISVFDKLYKRKVFDYPDFRLDKKGAYIRLRDEGDTITLAYKQRLGMQKDGKNDAGMTEIEVIVGDFEKTAQIMCNAGLIEKFYEENRRLRYSYLGINFDFDYWPLIPPFLEIEADSWENVTRGMELLDLKASGKKVFTTMQVYKCYGIDEFEYQILTFQKQVRR